MHAPKRLAVAVDHVQFTLIDAVVDAEWIVVSYDSPLGKVTAVTAPVMVPFFFERPDVIRSFPPASVFPVVFPETRPDH